MSAGVLTVDRQAASMNCLIRKADQVLYLSKDKKTESGNICLLVSKQQMAECAEIDSADGALPAIT
jgi:hypothetical protein